ncbi:putative integral membrane protein [Rhodopirellula islandica]|uniref:Integral membrane protein n=2 Tax=Rhodopirellula islandica TaxID=595434 RepID=A0A0J1BK65_RHOIS|nr:putative integral membrane protein [Rhodopirellula islandica]
MKNPRCVLTVKQHCCTIAKSRPALERRPTLASFNLHNPLCDFMAMTTDASLNGQATITQDDLATQADVLKGGPLTRWLSNANPTTFSIYCIIAAFGTYFCMYAFRKPFTAATYDGMLAFGVGYKTILITAQVAGYTLSKFIGIKVVSEMPPRYRAISIVALIAIAELALFLFAITPVPWNFVWLFVNGLPLGMVFGMVLGFLEGRAVTEALSAGLCASFILSSGFVKSVGRTLIESYQVETFWMPAITGLIFLLPLFLFVWMLSQIPAPSFADEQLRSKRSPMNGQQRRAFWRRHALGLTGLLTIYVLLTVIRSLRDDFAIEIWTELGVQNEPTVFARSEFWVMIGVVAISGLTSLIRDNRTAFLSSIGLLATGFVIVVAAVAGQALGKLSPMAFMVTLGFGMYVPYVAFHTTVFERMIAALKESGNIGYLMYLADALGYLGYIGVMLYRNSVTSDQNFLSLMNYTSVIVAGLASVITLFLCAHYTTKIPRQSRDAAVAD